MIHYLLIIAKTKIVIMEFAIQKMVRVNAIEIFRVLIVLCLFLHLIYVRVKIVIMENATINLENVYVI